MKKKHILLVIIILISLLFLNGCKKIENNGNNSHDYSDYHYTDERGYKRDNSGCLSECIILDQVNYQLYKDDLIGDGGVSGLLNKSLFNGNQNKLDTQKHYLVYVFYCGGEESIDINTYLKISLINFDEILFDYSAASFDNIIINEYKSYYGDHCDVSVDFDMNKEPFERLNISANGNYCKFIFFSVILPFNIKEEGKIDIDLSFSETNLNYEYQNNFNTIVGDKDVDLKLVKIDNYQVSYISESLCKDGNIDDSKLSKSARFVKNYSKFMVIDFDLTTLEDNDGTEKINLFLYIPDESLLKTSIEDAPSSEIEEEIVDSKKIIKISVSTQREKGYVKHCRFVVKFTPLSNEDCDINLFISGKYMSINDYQKEAIIARVSVDSLIYDDNGVITGVMDKSLSEVNIPAMHNGKEVRIGENAFADCKELCYVNIENGVKAIGKNSFLNCKSLINISFPTTIEEIESNSFDGCPNELFNKYNNCYYIGPENNNFLFLLKPESYEIEIVSLNANTKMISNHCFANCNKLNTVNLMNVNIIGKFAFENCSSLINIKFPKTLTTILSSAFYNCSSLAEINIPNNVKELGNNLFENCKSVVEIKLPKNITLLPDSIFCNCTSLESIDIAVTVKEIGVRAFYNCVSLNNIYVPKSVEVIGLGAFGGCTSLKQLNVPFVGNKRCETDDFTCHLGYVFGTNQYSNSYLANYNYQKSYYIPSLLEEVIITDVERIPSAAFKECTSIKKIIIPDNLKMIGNSSFELCESLVDIIIPANVEKIEDSAFKSCTSLENIIIPKNVVNIGNYTFEFCESLKSIVVPEGVESIGNSAFASCNLLQSVELPETIKMVGNTPFYNCPIEIASIPAELCQYINDIYLKKLTITSGTTLKNDVFSDCSSLKEVVIPNSMNYISTNAFMNCPIEKATIPMKFIDCFNNIDTLTEIEITNGHTLEYKAFKGLSSLEKIIIPNTIMTIECGALEGCTNLKELTIPFVGKRRYKASDDDKYPIGYLFGNYLNSTMNGLIDQYYSTTNTAATSIYKARIPKTLKEVNITDSQYLQYGAFYNCYYIEKITLSNSILSIGQKAFYNCTSLNEVILPDEIKYISSSLFYSCKALVNIALPNSVSRIYDNAFTNCTALTNFKMPKDIMRIETDAFNNCTNLTNVYFDGTIEDWCNYEPGSNNSNPMYYANYFYLKDDNGDIDFEGRKYSLLTDLELSDSIDKTNAYQFYNFKCLEKLIIDEGVNVIGQCSFSNCISLKTITLPGILEELGEKAFSNCEALKDIYLSKNIKAIGSSVFYNCTSLENVYYGGELEDWLEYSVTNTSSNPMYYAKNFYVQSDVEDVSYHGNVYNLLNKAIIPNNVSYIKDYQFYGFDCLNEIIMSDSVSEIGVMSFAKTKLKTIAFSKKLKIFGNFAFSDSLVNVYYDGTIEDWCDLSLLNDSSNPMYYASKFYIRDDSGDVKFDNNFYKLLKDLVIPENIEVIKDNQFYGFDCLSSVVGSNLTSIGAKAFYNCRNIENIAFSNKLINVSSNSFYGVSPTQATIPDSLISVINKKSLCEVKFIGKTIPADAFADCIHLTSVELTDDLSTIKSNAFGNCKKITHIEIPNSVAVIEESVFSGCGSMSIIKLPFIGQKRYDNSYSTRYPFGYIFGENSYSGSSKIKQNYLGGSTSYYIPTGLKEVVVTDSNYIQEGAFYNCSMLETIKLPDNVTTIDDNAFYNCSNIEKFEIPSSLECISNYTFSNCFSLEKIELTNNLLSIGNEAFTNCRQLKEIEIPKNVVEIGEACFSGCSNLEKMKLPFIGKTRVSSYPFGYIFGTIKYTNSLVEVEQTYSGGVRTSYIPNSLKTIEITDCSEIQDGAFENCSMVEIITIPQSILTIGNNAFKNCSSITNLRMSNEVKNIGKFAFENCISVNNFIIPNSLENIGDSAFLGCVGLNDIYYKGTIEDWANIKLGNTNSNPMSNALNLYILDLYGDVIFDDNVYSLITDLNISNNIFTINSKSFIGLDCVTSIFINNQVNSIEMGAFYGCLNVEKITLPFVGEKRYVSTDSRQYPLGYIFGMVEYKKSIEVVQEYYGGKTSFFIPEALKEVNITNCEYLQRGAFYNCSMLEIINIPKSITCLEEDTFFNCNSLQNAYFCKHIEEIKYGVFENCYSLNSIHLSDKLLRVCSGAFNNCNSINRVYYDGLLDNWINIIFENEKSNPMYYSSSFYIRDENGTIEFDNSSYSLLEELVIPDSINTIESYSFYGFDCIKNLILPSNVIELKNYCFSCCSSLKSIFISKEIKVIGKYTFNLSESISNIFYEGNIEDWNNITFSTYSSNPMYYAEDFNCLDVNGELTFNNMKFSKLNKLIISESFEIVNDYVFYGFNDLEEIVVPLNTKYYYDSFSKMNAKKCTVPYEFLTYLNFEAVYELVLLNGNTIDSKLFNNCSNLKRIILPNSIYSIASGAFSGCSSLEFVELPFVGDKKHKESDFYQYPFGYIFGTDEYENSIGVIQRFRGNSTASNSTATYYIPKSLYSVCVNSDYLQIGAFSGCSNLINIELLGIIKIKKDAFLGCNSLKNVYFDANIDEWISISFEYLTSNPMSKASNLYFINNDGGVTFNKNNYNLVKKTIISDNISMINDYQFYGSNNIQEIIIPNIISSIGEYAFYNCSSLTTVYYEGTEEEWNQIVIKSGNDYLINATIIYNYTGE